MFSSKRIENPIDLDKPLIVNEILTDIGDESLNIRSYYRINETKKIHRDVFRYLLSTCMYFGVNYTFPSMGRKPTYRLIVNHFLCHSNESNQRIFRDILLDAAFDGKKIFSNQIEGVKPKIIKEDEAFPVVVLKYNSDEDQLRDCISITNYIKENLDAGKNRDN